MMGYKLNEKLNAWCFWLFMIGFNVCFLPQFILGLDGMPRRLYTYMPSDGWWLLNVISTIGALLMGWFPILSSKHCIQSYQSST